MSQWLEEVVSKLHLRGIEKLFASVLNSAERNTLLVNTINAFGNL